jgi:hypothetical protein
MDDRQLALCKEEAYKIASIFDWEKLISNYLRAYELAAEKKFGQKLQLLKKEKNKIK